MLITRTRHFFYLVVIYVMCLFPACRMKLLKWCLDGSTSTAWDYAGLMCNLYREAGLKRCHHSQTSRVQSTFNPFYTCCWLGCTIPLLLPSNSSILSLQLLPLLPSLTCARVRGNRHQGKSLTIFHMDWLNPKIPIENMDNLCDSFGWKKFQNNFQNYLMFFFSSNEGYCEICYVVVKLTYLRYKKT